MPPFVLLSSGRSQAGETVNDDLQNQENGADEGMGEEGMRYVNEESQMTVQKEHMLR